MGDDDEKILGKNQSACYNSSRTHGRSQDFSKGGGGGVGGSHCVKQRVLALSQPEYR